MAAQKKDLYDGSSGSALYTDRRDFYVSPLMVKEQYPIVTPFLTFVANFNKIKVLKDPQYKMFQHRNPWVRQYIQMNDSGTVTTAADNAADACTISATGSTGLSSTFTAALLGLKCGVYASTTPAAISGKPTGASLGTIVVTTFTNATTISVKNLTGASIVIPQYGFLQVEGSEHGEGSEAPAGWTDELQVVWNQAGIHRTAFQLTNRIMKASLRGESDEYDRVKKQKSQEHKIQNERQLMFSRNEQGPNLNQSDTFADGARTDANSNVLRSTYGAFSAIEDYGVTSTTSDDQNIFDIAEASYTWNDFVDQTEKSFEFSDDGIQPMFAGRSFISYWSKMSGSTGEGLAATSKWTVNLGNPQKGRLGFYFKELETPHGIYQLVPTRSLDKSTYGKYGFAPGKDDIFLAEYEKPVFAQNISTNNNPLYQKNEYVTENGMGITNLPVHKMFKLT
tara:strand:+ start:4101 stop:5453 length:1353 start_codon:yes stop_codon:yes gene_type:complete